MAFRDLPDDALSVAIDAELRFGNWPSEMLAERNRRALEPEIKNLLESIYANNILPLRPEK